MMENMTDKELMCLLDNGGRENRLEIFDLLYKRHHRTMYQYSLRLLKSPEASSDIVQDVFIKLWEHMEYISPEINVKAYLYSMVRNRVINYIRDNRNRLIHNYRILQETGTVEEMRLISLYEDNSRRKEVTEAFNLLPPQQRKVMRERFEGKTNREIAKEQNLSLSTVNIHYRLGLKTLKDVLKILILLIHFIR